MTESFPKLKEGQVALSRADANTGIVLDEQYSYAVRPDQRVYTVMDNLVEAVKVAKLMIAEKQTIECYIHGPENKLVYLLTVENVDSIPD